MGENSQDSPQTILPPLGSETPERIGRYAILQKLGEGGMGEVYEAEQTEPVHRKVALKLIKWGMDTKQVTARFESERQALALMNHPNIARVLDAGATEQGRLYFVMELAKGVSITEYCDTYRLSTRDRLELFLQVCDGVQHAHQKGVIHRDIKPSNVLITMRDGKPVPKLIDFGVAKATSRRLTERTLYTEMGQLMGTPEYMSPEQAGLSGLDIDTRTDVYSLGLLLYELLVGALPFDPKELRKVRFDELCRKIREDEPPRPSTRVSALGVRASDVADKRATDATSLARQLRSDLDWIVMRAIEKDRTRRYPSATDLAADVKRYLRHEPVQACPPSTFYRVGKFVRRHRFGVIASALVAVTMIIGIAGTSIGLVRALRAERRATQEAEAAHQVSEFLVQIFGVSDPGEAQGREITARELLDRGSERIGIELEEQPLVQARLMNSIGRVYRNLGYFEQARPLLERSLRIRERELGPDNLEVAETRHNLGVLAADTGNYEEAKKFYEQALKTRERELGPDHPAVAETLNGLARLHHYKGEFDEARPLYERALKIREASGPDYALAETLNDLASLLHVAGEFDAARPLYERALEVATQARGADSYDAACTLHNLATLLYQTGDLDGARSLYERSLRIFEKVLGPDHPQVGDSVNNLAILLHTNGDYEAARPLYERALRMSEKILGPNHPDTATSLNNLANLLRDTGDHDAARPLYERALRIRESVFGPNHQMVAVSLKDMAEMYRRSGEKGRAKTYLERALRIDERTLGADHPDTAEVANELADLLTELGDLASAEPLYRRALETREAKLGAEHPAVAETLEGYAELLKQLGRGDEADRLEERAAAIRRGTKD